VHRVTEWSALSFHGLLASRQQVVPIWRCVEHIFGHPALRGNSAATTAALGRTRFFGKCRILIVSELEDNKARGCGQQSK
jgi:hypothetical protein